MSIAQPLVALGIVTMNPIAQRLTIHSATLRCNLAMRPLKHHRYGQKPPRNSVKCSRILHSTILHTTFKLAQFLSAHIFALNLNRSTHNSLPPQMNGFVCIKVRNPPQELCQWSDLLQFSPQFPLPFSPFRYGVFWGERMSRVHAELFFREIIFSEILLPIWDLYAVSPDFMRYPRI